MGYQTGGKVEVETFWAEKGSFIVKFPICSERLLKSLTVRLVSTYH